LKTKGQVIFTSKLKNKMTITFFKTIRNGKNN
jgi:hypothetical protein